MSDEVTVYVNVPGRCAAYSTYTYAGPNMVVLFKCPREWVPKTQAEFEQACAFHNIPRPDRLRWQAIETF